MHNIATLGDVRVHAVYHKSPSANVELGSYLLDYESPWAVIHGLGGAARLSDAIKTAIDMLKEHGVETIPTAYGFNEKERLACRQAPSLDVIWDAGLKAIRDETEGRMRLGNPRAIVQDKISRTSFVPFPEDVAKLIHATQKDRQAANAVSLLVAEDLGIHLRNVDLQSTDKAWEDLCELSPPRFAKKIKRIAKDRDHSGLAKLLNSLDLEIEQLQNRGYGLLLGTLLDALESTSVAGKSAPANSSNEELSPLLILAVGAKLPSETNDDFHSQRLWGRLTTSEQLRQRTIIVLDANELRHDGIQISSALSWERTASDLVNQFDSNPRLTRLRSFRHIIVRFGLTGALHISHESHNDELRYILHFDPAHDDVEFNEVTNGYVLGLSSVFLASLVRELCSACSRRAGGHVKLDLSPALSHGIRSGIYRSQTTFKHGYGTSWDDCLWIIRQHSFMPPGIFAEPICHLVDQRMAGDFSGFWPEVPLELCEIMADASDEWSIAERGTHGHVREVAAGIALRGVMSTLNQADWSIEAFEDSLVGIAKRLYVEAIHELPASPPPTPLPKSPKKLADIPANLVDRLKHCFLQIEKEQILYSLRQAYGSYTQRLREHFSGPGRDIDFGTLFVRDVEDKTLVLTNDDYRMVFRDFAKWFVNVTDIREVFSQRNATCPAPFARFGRKEGNKDRRMVVVDRQEIEGLRLIRNLIESHRRDVRNDQAEKPLAIAVFGPPGSGKSYAIKCVVNSVIENEDEVEWIRVNLAQFTRGEDLNEVFANITNVMAQKKIPIVFFDEFDSSLGEELGWLKFFLAPMEDGEYKGQKVKNAIFVFAGGTAETFREFRRENRVKTDPQWTDFAVAKGPDFVSRLRGHLNIVGINSTGESDHMWLIRRAIALRSLLQQSQDLGTSDEARIDDDVLHALLHVPEYRHGTRSMQNVLHLFSGRRKRITHSDLPPLEQLDMHVNGQGFLKLISEFRSPK